MKSFVSHTLSCLGGVLIGKTLRASDEIEGEDTDKPVPNWKLHLWGHVSVKSDSDTKVETLSFNFSDITGINTGSMTQIGKDLADSPFFFVCYFLADGTQVSAKGEYDQVDQVIHLFDFDHTIHHSAMLQIDDGEVNCVVYADFARVL